MGKISILTISLKKMEEISNYRQDHTNRTKYLKPIEPVTFDGHDLLCGLFSAINPRNVTSINILHGERKGVVRMTCKTNEASVDFDTKVALHKVCINGVRLATVSESGHFIHATLMDVPEYLRNTDIELILNSYGAVAHIKKEFFEYQSYQLENETRHVLFSYLIKEIPEIITLDGFEVIVKYTPQIKTRTMYGVSDLITKPDNIPKHVLEKIEKTMSKSDVHEKSRIFPKRNNRGIEYGSQDEDYSTGQSVFDKKMSVCSTDAADIHSYAEIKSRNIKTLSLADLPQCEQKEDFTSKYDKEIETLSLMSRSPSYSEKDVPTGRGFAMFRRPSVDSELDERQNQNNLMSYNWKMQDPETQL